MKHFDAGSITVIAITFILFALALLTTGFTHDFFLEAVVFLVSVKLLVMAYKANKSAEKRESYLEELKALLKKSEKNT